MQVCDNSATVCFELANTIFIIFCENSLEQYPFLLGTALFHTAHFNDLISASNGNLSYADHLFG